MEKIYGVDLDKPVNGVIARNALVECFYTAHCLDSGISVEDDTVDRIYCYDLIKQGFKDSGGNFDNPTKQDLQNVIKGLAKFAQNFRNQCIVEEHVGNMMKIIAAMPE
jgi:hypothetical protein